MAALGLVGWQGWAWWRQEGVPGTGEASAMAEISISSRKELGNMMCMAVEPKWKSFLVGDAEGYTKP